MHVLYHVNGGGARGYPACMRDYCDTLQFITAVEGSEKLLNRLFEYGAPAMPLMEQREWREKLPMPEWIWEWLDTVSRESRTGGWHATHFMLSKRQLLVKLREHFDETPLVLPDEFTHQRVDVSLASLKTPEYPCIPQRRDRPNNPIPGQTPERESLLIRAAQINQHPDWKKLASRFPHFTRSETKRAILQMQLAFQQREVPQRADLIIFPEVYLPSKIAERRALNDLVQQTGTAALVGLAWRTLPSSASSRITTGRTYVVNEACLVLPVPSRGTKISFTRNFIIRKPVPAHSELGLLEAVTTVTPSKQAHVFVPGQKVFRFVHSAWGDFTVAICSDLIEPRLWADFQGQVLHLFACAYNQDIRLFESLTWTRAYELCANVVAVNAGEYGGSFAWSPKHGEDKELLMLKAPNSTVIASVTLPVNELHEWQMQGVRRSEKKHEDWFAGSPKKQGQSQILKFKAPPPGFKSRLAD
jgi:hypothetical protein